MWADTRHCARVGQVRLTPLGCSRLGGLGGGLTPAQNRDLWFLNCVSLEHMRWGKETAGWRQWSSRNSPIWHCNSGSGGMSLNESNQCNQSNQLTQAERNWWGHACRGRRDSMAFGPYSSKVTWVLARQRIVPLFTIPFPGPTVSATWKY